MTICNKEAQRMTSIPRDETQETKVTFQRQTSIRSAKLQIKGMVLKFVLGRSLTLVHFSTVRKSQCSFLSLDAKYLAHLLVFVLDRQIRSVHFGVDSFDLIVLSFDFVTKAHGQSFEPRHSVRHHVWKIEWHFWMLCCCFWRNQYIASGARWGRGHLRLMDRLGFQNSLKFCCDTWQKCVIDKMNKHADSGVKQQVTPPNLNCREICSVQTFAEQGGARHGTRMFRMLEQRLWERNFPSKVCRWQAKFTADRQTGKKKMHEAFSFSLLLTEVDGWWWQPSYTTLSFLTKFSGAAENRPRWNPTFWSGKLQTNPNFCWTFARAQPFHCSSVFVPAELLWNIHFRPRRILAHPQSESSSLGVVPRWLSKSQGWFSDGTAAHSLFPLAAQAPFSCHQTTSSWCHRKHSLCCSGVAGMFSCHRLWCPSSSRCCQVVLLGEVVPETNDKWCIIVKPSKFNKWDFPLTWRDFWVIRPVLTSSAFGAVPHSSTVKKDTYLGCSHSHSFWVVDGRQCSLCALELPVHWLFFHLLQLFCFAWDRFGKFIVWYFPPARSTRMSSKWTDAVVFISEERVLPTWILRHICHKTQKIRNFLQNWY